MLECTQGEDGRRNLRNKLLTKINWNPQSWKRQPFPWSTGGVANHTLTLDLRPQSQERKSRMSDCPQMQLGLIGWVGVCTSPGCSGSTSSQMCCWEDHRVTETGPLQVCDSSVRLWRELQWLGLILSRCRNLSEPCFSLLYCLCQRHRGTMAVVHNIWKCGKSLPYKRLAWHCLPEATRAHSSFSLLR